MANSRRDSEDEGGDIVTRVLLLACPDHRCCANCPHMEIRPHTKSRKWSCNVGRYPAPEHQPRNSRYVARVFAAHGTSGPTILSSGLTQKRTCKGFPVEVAT